MSALEEMMSMTAHDVLVEQICALPLAERLLVREALDDSVERDLESRLTTDSPVAWAAERERLEQELLRGLDSGPPRVADKSYWQELWGRVELRRRTVTAV